MHVTKPIKAVKMLYLESTHRTCNTRLCWQHPTCSTSPAAAGGCDLSWLEARTTSSSAGAGVVAAGWPGCYTRHWVWQGGTHCSGSKQQQEDEKQQQQQQQQQQPG
jgi:hypothetical protein